MRSRSWRSTQAARKPAVTRRSQLPWPSHHPRLWLRDARSMLLRTKRFLQRVLSTRNQVKHRWILTLGAPQPILVPEIVQNLEHHGNARVTSVEDDRAITKLKMIPGAVQVTHLTHGGVTATTGGRRSITKGGIHASGDDLLDVLRHLARTTEEYARAARAPPWHGGCGVQC